MNSLSPALISSVSSLSSTWTACPSGRDLTISKIFLPLTVIAPGFSISAPMCVLRPTSRSVPVSSISDAETFIRMLARIGIVFRFSDDALEDLQFVQERFLGDGEFHGVTFRSVFLLILSYYLNHNKN